MGSEPSKIQQRPSGVGSWDDGVSNGNAGASSTETMTAAGLVASARGAMIRGFVTAAVGAVLKVVPYIAMVEIARGLLAGQTSHLWWWVIAAVVTLVLYGACYSYALGSNHIAEAKLRHELRIKIVNKLGRVNLGWFTARNAGVVRQAVAKDTAQIHTLVAHLAGDLANAVFSVLTSLVYLSYLNWQFTGMLFAAWVLFVAAVMALGMRGLKQMFQDYAATSRQLSGATVELVDGIKEVKNYVMTATMFSRFEAARRAHSTLSLRWLNKQGLGMALIGAAIQPGVVFALTVVVGVLGVNAGLLTPVTVLAFGLIWVSLPEGLMAITQMSRELYAASQAARSTIEILNAPELPIADEPQVSDLLQAGLVELRDVSFCYEANEPIFEHVSLTCPPGTVTALVGPSGSGKSTLARLIARFWDVDSGQVLVGGVDVREQTNAQLMKAMALVFQDTMLSADTIAGNIALGKPTATREEIIAAAQSACIHERIMQLPQGYDTNLGEGSCFLSGGEQQRLTIARAFLQTPQVLILDEATAQADAHSEREIQQALSNLAQNRTVIVIAHRLQTIQGVDQIAVIADRKLAECGTHAELLKQGGRYAHMWAQQTATPASPTAAAPESELRGL